MKLFKIDVVDTITKKDFIKNYKKQQKPLLIKGYAKQWPTFSQWNLNTIKEKAKGQEVPIYNNEPAAANKSSDTPALFMTMDDYINEIQNYPSDKRIFFYIIKNKLPDLLINFKYPDLGMKIFKQIHTLFFGGSEARVLMHYDVDMSDFFHVHFEGRKRILLFDQKQSKYLYKVPLSVHTIEAIDYENPDYDRYPALKKAEGYEIFMDHGDMLYIPCAWWHFNRYLEPGFSMSMRERPSPLRFKNFLSTFYHVFFMRYTDKICRKIGKDKWIRYKERWAFKNANK